MPHARRPYPSDLTDQGWNLLKPQLASPRSEGVRHNGLCTPRRRCRLLYTALSLRPADAASGVPYSRQTVHYHFRKRRLDGRSRRAHERLRAAVRESEGRNPEIRAGR